jgi:hypothetical protein
MNIKIENNILHFVLQLIVFQDLLLLDDNFSFLNLSYLIAHVFHQLVV